LRVCTGWFQQLLRASTWWSIPKIFWHF
jgi:hypothetical protein